MSFSRTYRKSYEVTKTEEYIQQFDEIYKRFPRSIELNNAIVWALERYPHSFENLAHDFYHWITAELASEEYPIVKILFRILSEENKVILLSVEEY